jgi:hypothetical protein
LKFKEEEGKDLPGSTSAINAQSGVYRLPMMLVAALSTVGVTMEQFSSGQRNMGDMLNRRTGIGHAANETTGPNGVGGGN